MVYVNKWQKKKFAKEVQISNKHMTKNITLQFWKMFKLR